MGEGTAETDRAMRPLWDLTGAQYNRIYETVTFLIDAGAPKMAKDLVTAIRQALDAKERDDG